MLLIEDFAMELKKYNLYIIELFERENLKLSDYIDVDRFKSIIEEQDIIYPNPADDSAAGWLSRAGLFAGRQTRHGGPSGTQCRQGRPGPC